MISTEEHVIWSVSCFGTELVIYRGVIKNVSVAMLAHVCDVKTDYPSVGVTSPQNKVAMTT